MSVTPRLPEETFNVTPVEKTTQQKFNFGAIVSGLDLNEISESNVERLRDSIWANKVIVVKGQNGLTPKNHWRLVTRFDPDAPQVHSHGDAKSFNKTGGVLTKSTPTVAIPEAENVRLIGKGYQGADHYGIKDLTVAGLSNDFHADKLADDEFQKGNTRFQRWHMDAPLYARDPAWFTTLRAMKLPAGPDITINWDDGSGYSLKSPPGLTAFFSTSQLYSLLSEEEQQMADHSWVEYAPHPYRWIEHCGGNTTGLGLKNEGKEHTIEELGDYEEKQVKKYPMVWLNPVTGEKAFQVHGICALKLFIRSSPTETPKVMSNVLEIRQFLHKIQSRILKPEYIWLPPVEVGDIVMWDNYGVFHSAVDYPLASYGPRTMHQANIGASIGPRGPVPIPAMG